LQSKTTKINKTKEIFLNMSKLQVNLMPKNYRTLRQNLLKTFPSERLITDPLRLLTFATDASHYRLIPQIVVIAETENEVVDVIRNCRQLQIPLTYRAAGTSLSGQAISDSVLLIAAHGWNKYKILDNGAKIRLQPGITGAQANRYLAHLGRKIGPDPASIQAAMIGGIAANNASGMCCGTAQNSYKTLADVRIVLYDGTILDTSDEQSVAAFRKEKAELIGEIERLRDEIAENKELIDRIKRKFKIKNTTGYSINALVDYTDPIDIIKHLIIGSEGTLAFISNIVYNTVEEDRLKACSLLLFETVEKACAAIPLLKKCPVSAVELLDRISIRSVENDPDAPEWFKTLPPTACALLVEIRANDSDEFARKEQEIRAALPEGQTIQPYIFTSDPKEYNFNWKARKGLLPSVGSMRQSGTTCLIEDVAFPIEKLADACIAMQELFARLGYNDAVLFGHALEGNLHIVFSQDFSSQKEIEKYSKMMDGLADIVINRFDGSMKAEHGTGRNVAPYVEKEWGEQAYRIMLRIKQIFDPDHLINPGVIINKNNKIHLENFKPLPVTDTFVDKCTECGFCEPVCPVRNLSLTPRKRIVAYREICRLKKQGTDNERLKEFVKNYSYLGEQTCATDGLCERECPNGINTGKLIKTLRHEQASATGNRIASLLAGNMDKLTAAMRFGLNIPHFIAKITGYTLIEKICFILFKISGKRFPVWTRFTPKGNDWKTCHSREGGNDKATVVYFPSCINRSMGVSPDYKEKVALTKKMKQILEKAGYNIVYPENINKLCCGMAFDSKGFVTAGLQKASELEAALLKASDNGQIPVLCDMSPCLYRMKETLDKRLELHEPVSFILKYLADKLQFHKLPITVAIHSTCSNTKMNQTDALYKLASMCAEKVIVPDVNCCAWAGDRGFFYPEMNSAALEILKESVKEASEGYSTSRTCEIGLSMHSGITYQSIVYLVDKATEKAKNSIRYEK